MCFRRRRDSRVGWLGFSLLNNKDSLKVLCVLVSELHFQICLAAMAKGLVGGDSEGLGERDENLEQSDGSRKGSRHQARRVGEVSLWPGTRLGSSEGV